MAEILTLLKSVPLLQGFDRNLLLHLSEGIEPQNIKQGEILFSSGTPVVAVYIVFFGSLRLIEFSSAGKEVIMTFLRQGDFAGAGVIHGDSTLYPITAVAHTDSRILKIPKKYYEKNWSAYPDLMIKVHQHLMRRMVEFQNDKILHTCTASKRIASFFLQMLEQQPTHFGDTINIPLTRRDISQRVGTTVETVIRILSDWTQKNWIHTKDHSIEILERNELRRIVETEK